MTEEKKTYEYLPDEYEKEMLDYLDSKHPDILNAIKAEEDLSDDTDKKLKAALDEFKGIFQPAS